jgi:hypothetical protein
VSGVAEFKSIVSVFTPDLSSYPEKYANLRQKNPNFIEKSGFWSTCLKIIRLTVIWIQIYSIYLISRIKQELVNKIRQHQTVGYIDRDGGGET